MSKIDFIMQANSELNEKTASILMVVAKNNFIDAAGIREKLPEISSASANSNIGVLVKKGFIEKSDTGFVLTENGQQVILDAADLNAKANPTKIRNTRKPKGVSEEMKTLSETFKGLIEEVEGVTIKEVAENRSNLEIRLEKRLNGIRQFEVRHAGIIRIFGYKIPQGTIDKLVAAGATVKNKGVNFYIDMETTEENMVKMIEASK